MKNQLHRVSRGGSDPDIPESCVRDCEAREDRLLVFKAAHSLESMNMSQEYTRLEKNMVAEGTRLLARYLSS